MPDESFDVSWEELLSILSPQKSSKQKCSIRLLDTCFINGDVEDVQWYYTTKNGSIALKKRDKKKDKKKAKAEDISSRFSKFALANPANNDLEKPLVGTLVTPTGDRIYIEADEVKDFLENTKSYESYGIDFLQVYLRPQFGVDQVAVASFAAGDTRCFLKANKSVELTDIGVIENSEFIMNQMSLFTNEIVSCMKDKSFEVKSMSTEYIIDDNGHIWLSRVSQLTISPFADNDDDGQTRQTVSESQANSDSESPTQLTKARKVPAPAASSELLPELPPRTTSSQGRVKHPDHAVALSPGGRLLRREGGVYKCTMGPDDLPGLRAWILTGINEGSGEENTWAIDLQEYAGRVGANKDLDALRESRSSLRRTTASVMVSFVDKAERLLTAEERVENEEDLKMKWKNAYQDALVSDSFKVGSGELKICGNCEAIVAKLQSLISADFKASVHVSSSVGDHPEQRNDDAASGLLTLQESDKAETASDKPKDKLTAGNKKPSKKSVSSVSSRGKKHIKEGVGPSVDMLAKFAAERDRQHQLLAKQERMMGIDSAVKDSVQSTKSKDKSSKQNKQKKNILKGGTPVNTLAENERRLLELEKQASDSAAHFSRPPHSQGNVEALGSAISMSEESFLMRQSAQGDVSQFSTLHNSYDDSVSLDTRRVVSNMDHERDKKVIVQLKNQLDEKEGLVQQLQARVQQQDGEIVALEKKNASINKSFANYRNNADEDKDDRITDLESDILRLKDEYSRDMAKYTLLQATTAAPEASTSSSGGSERGGASSQGTNALIAQLDSLRSELRAVTEKSIADRKALQTEASIKYLSAEKKYNTEANQLRNTISELEVRRFCNGL